ncbi:hypothetical protein [Nocardia sp. NPDC050710]|uniref:F0F1 ATP synthase subunit B family protein n=1 Tax=Nocardia sp. NPDC050710 TaxID=3157220 RepID=UPI00341044C5
MFHIAWDWPVFLGQLFGFVILVYVLARWVAPRVRMAMVKTQNSIRMQLEESERAAVQVVAAAEAHEAALAQAGLAAAQLEKDAHAAAERILADMREEAEAAAVRTRRHGRARIEQVRRELVRELRTGFHAAVLERTEHMVRQRLGSAQAESDGVDRFLDELEAMA